MIPESLMNTSQQKSLYERLVSKGYITVRDVQAAYKSSISSREFLKRIVLLKIAKVSPTQPETFIYISPNDPALQEEKYVNAIRQLQAEYENVIPEIRIIDLLFRVGITPLKSVEVRDRLIQRGMIKTSKNNCIVVIDKILKLGVPNMKEGESHETRIESDGSEDR